MKAFCKHCWVHSDKWKPLMWDAFSVHWVHSDRTPCYKADPVRHTLSESGLCWADLQRDRMGRLKDAHSCLNVSAFFGGGTDRLVFGTAAAEWREAGGGHIIIAPPRLLSTSSHHRGREVLNAMLQLNQSWLARNFLIYLFFLYIFFQTTPGSSWPFPQSCPQPRSSPSVRVISQMGWEWLSVCTVTLRKWESIWVRDGEKMWNDVFWESESLFHAEQKYPLWDICCKRAPEIADLPVTSPLFR